ncbi:MAG: TIGR02281 family clan AA aspartic protease [Xanthobacteraceae bacterium]
MRMIIIFAAMILAIGVAVPHLLENAGRAASPSMAATPPPATPSANSRSMVLSPGNGNHFWVNARIDGRRMDLVVDTGASQVALRASDAARLGIHPALRDYSVRVSTANGLTKAALVELRSVELGDIVVRDVQALVHADDALGVNLLGMSFLSRVRWSHERGKLILEQ